MGGGRWLYVLYAPLVLHLFLRVIPEHGQGLSVACREHWRCAQWYPERGDTADTQWTSFHDSLPLLVAFAALNLFIKQLITRFFDDGDHSLAVRVVLGLVFVTVLHGYHTLVVLAILLGGFILSHVTKHIRNRSIRTGLAWAYAVSLMLLKESYRVKHMQCFRLVRPLFDSTYSNSYSWHLACNFIILRCLSFQLDLIGSEDSSSADFSLGNYLAYSLYWQQYMAGPILPFADFVQQCKPSHHSASSPLSRATLVYALRWLLCLAVMLYMLRRFPVFALQRSALVYTLPPHQLAVYLYLLLKMMWLKFLLIWRFFTLLALVDGIQLPENMLRCVSNNHSLAAFWKGWHASFNKWIVRYMYRPLCGINSSVAVWAVFLFVALWHDSDAKLLVWGALNALFYLVEVGVGKAFIRMRARGVVSDPLLAVLATLGGGLHILVLISANTIGYALGLNGFKHVASAVLGSVDGARALLFSFLYLCLGVNIMKALEFELALREAEAQSRGGAESRGAEHPCKDT